MTEPATLRMERTTRAPAETRGLGERIGLLLLPGDVVALSGELGAGKTELARGICRGAGVRDEDVSSPTFAIVATYRGRLEVHHADLYRIGDEDELHATGFYDLVGRDGASVVEWADRFPGALPAERLEVRIESDLARPTTRRLLVSGFGKRYVELVRALAPGRHRAR